MLAGFSIIKISLSSDQRMVWQRTKYQPYTDTLRFVRLSILPKYFQIRNGYMHLI